MRELETRKVITAREAFTLASEGQVRSLRPQMEMPGLSGFVSMYDRSSGRPVFQMRKNLIVLRGRTFALELLFANVIGSQGVNGPPAPYQSDLSRFITCFMVGNGGAPSSDPFSPYVPPPTGPDGVLLASPIPFLEWDTAQGNGGNDPANTINPANYGDAILVPGGSGTQYYFWQKNFDVVPPVWYFSESQNTVYKEVAMSVQTYECRTPVGNSINELGLFFGKVGSPSAGPAGTVNYVETEMFSRITFATEFLSDGKSLAIVYRIYA